MLTVIWTGLTSSFDMSQLAAQIYGTSICRHKVALSDCFVECECRMHARSVTSCAPSPGKSILLSSSKKKQIIEQSRDYDMSWSSC